MRAVLIATLAAVLAAPAAADAHRLSERTAERAVERHMDRHPMESFSERVTTNGARCRATRTRHVRICFGEFRRSREATDQPFCGGRYRAEYTSRSRRVKVTVGTLETWACTARSRLRS